MVRAHALNLFPKCWQQAAHSRGAKGGHEGAAGVSSGKEPGRSILDILGKTLWDLPAALEVTKGRTRWRMAAALGLFWVMCGASGASCPCCRAPGSTHTQTASRSQWSWLLAAAFRRPATSDASKSILGRMGVAPAGSHLHFGSCKPREGALTCSSTGFSLA